MPTTIMPETTRIALGNIAVTTSIQDDSRINEQRKSNSENRRLRWMRQGEAQKILSDCRVVKCKSYMNGKNVDLIYVQRHKAAHYTGLITCGLVWVCPICAAKICTRRRDELKQAINKHTENGGEVLMSTYTIPHTKQDKLSEVMKTLENSMKRLQGGRTAQSSKKKFEIVGTVTVREVTYGNNGWHYHIHQLVFISPGTDIDAYEKTMNARWEKATSQEGAEVNEHGYKLNRTYSNISFYITKFGFDSDERWGAAEEITQAHAKQSRSDKGITPFAMLDLSAKGLSDFSQLFREYARWIKGKRQLVWSKGLRKALLEKPEEMTDLEIATEPEKDSALLYRFNRKQWNFIKANNLRGSLLEIAQCGQANPVKQFLWNIGIEKVDAHEALA